jgi:hypothetical protein
MISYDDQYRIPVTLFDIKTDPLEPILSYLKVYIELTRYKYNRTYEYLIINICPRQNYCLHYVNSVRRSVCLASCCWPSPAQSFLVPSPFQCLTTHSRMSRVGRSTFRTIVYKLPWKRIKNIFHYKTFYGKG